MGLDDYRIGQKLGAGSFGVVSKAIKLDTNETVAVKDVNVTKIIDSGASSFSQIKLEVRLLRAIAKSTNCSKHMVCWKDDFFYLDDQSQTHLVIVTNYVEGPTLLKYLEGLKDRGQQIDINLYFKIIQQLTEAVTYLHINKIAHRDIKLDNIIMDTTTNDAVLVDFGLACYEDCRGTPGTLYYYPPEILLRLKTGLTGLEASKKHDIWSLGIVFYALGNLGLPFMLSPKKITEKELRRPFPSRYRSDPTTDGVMAPVINHVIRRMISFEPQKRPTADEIRQYLELERRGLDPNNPTTKRIPMLLIMAAYGRPSRRPFNQLNNLYQQHLEVLRDGPTAAAQRSLVNNLVQVDDQRNL